MSEITIRIPLHAIRELLAAIQVDGHVAQPSSSRSQPQLPAGDRPWTPAQRRLVMKLVYRKGYEGDRAENFVLEALGLRQGDTPTAAEASKLIDKLKERSDAAE